METTTKTVTITQQRGGTTNHEEKRPMPPTPYTKLIEAVRSGAVLVDGYTADDPQRTSRRAAEHACALVTDTGECEAEDADGEPCYSPRQVAMIDSYLVAVAEHYGAPLPASDTDKCECDCDCDDAATTTDDGGVHVCDACADYYVTPGGDVRCSRVTVGGTRCPDCGDAIQWGGIQTGGCGAGNWREGTCQCPGREWSETERGSQWALGHSDASDRAEDVLAAVDAE